MDPVTLILTGISVAKGLMGLAVDVAPLVVGIKNSIDGLLGKGHITEEQAAELRSKSQELDDEWAALLAAARKEAAGKS